MTALSDARNQVTLELKGKGLPNVVDNYPEHIGQPTTHVTRASVSYLGAGQTLRTLRVALDVLVVVPVTEGVEKVEEMAEHVMEYAILSSSVGLLEIPVDRISHDSAAGTYWTRVHISRNNVKIT